MSSSDFDEPQFLEPAHHHDPTKIAYIAGIPAALVENLPADAQKALWDIQESASVSYASWRRFEELWRERFHRLVPAKKQNHEEAIQCKSDPKSRPPIMDISHAHLLFIYLNHTTLTLWQTRSRLSKTTSTRSKLKRLTSSKKQ
jgi:hypothetical protein